jgi:hypothetical protein
MAYRPHGRASVDAENPRAFGRCDRCGFIYNLGSLRFQFDFRGPRLTNLRFLVCQTCYDKPQPQLKPIILTEDPVPVANPRPEDYNYANTNDIFAETPSTTYQQTGIPVPQGSDLITEDDKQIEGQPIGPPAGLDPNAVMPLYGTKAYNVLLPVLFIGSDGRRTVTVTCSAAHGLVDNDQVTVEGISNPLAGGFYSIKYVSPTVFSYYTFRVIKSGNMLTSTSRICTALVGLPPKDTEITLIGSSLPTLAIVGWTNNTGDPVGWSNSSNQPVGWQSSNL